MDRNPFRSAAQPSAPTPTRAWLFAQALLGNPIPNPLADQPEGRLSRERLERLATFSSEHASQLRHLLSNEAEARRRRDQLEWLAKISPVHESELRRLQAAEAETRAVQEYAQRLREETTLLEGQWDPSKHPRGAYSQNPGWFSPSGGAGGEATHSGASTAGNGSTGHGFMSVPDKIPKRGKNITKFDPSNSFLPADSKGTWLGKKGDSIFRLTKPVNVNGKLIREIQFDKGFPKLEHLTLPGTAAHVILTGDSKADIRNARRAWKELNPGIQPPPGSTFHHDMLHVTKETVVIDGKKTQVLIGKMQLVPIAANEAVFHEGSASVAGRFYKGSGADVSKIKQFAKEQAVMFASSNSLVARAAKKITPGKFVGGIFQYMGRTAARVLPIVGTGLAIIEFSSNVEAHGIGGAVARATPILGDLISAHDLGSDLAKQIADDANAAMGAAYHAINTPVAEAAEKASHQAIEAFRELAAEIEVTNEYGPEGLVNPNEVAAALQAYRNEMQAANLLKMRGVRNFDFQKTAAQARLELKERLTKASQSRARQKERPSF